MKKDLVVILRNKNYMLLVLTYAMVFGVYSCLGAIINNLASAYGFSSVDASIFGAVFIISGLVGSFIISSLLDKYNTYLKALRTVCFGSLACGACLRLTFPLGPPALVPVVINIGAVGVFIIPIIPVSYAFSVELTYPVSEAMSNGSMMLVSQLLSVFATIIATKLADHNPDYCLYMFYSMFVVGSLATLFIKEDLRRLNMDKKLQNDKENENEN